MACAADPPADSPRFKIPLPLIGTSSLPPQTRGYLIEPLTPGGKVKDSLRRTIGPKALANRALLAGWNQWHNRPEEWGQGWDAYGKRYGYRMTRLASRNAIILGFDLAMHTDQRYDRCDCSGFWGRTGHAIRRVFVARKDSGGETVNMGRIAGAYAGLAVAYQVLPDRYQTPGRILTNGSQYLGWRALSNTLREFWPEIHRKLRIGPAPTSRRAD